MLAPQVAPELQELTSDLMRAMMLTPLVFSISGLLMGLLHAHQRFLLPSLAISMNSIGLIIGALLIAPALPPDPGAAQVGDANVYGLAWGAVLSALLHLLVQLPGLRGLGAQLRPLADWSSPALRDVLRLMGPRVLGLAVARVNFLVNAAFTSAMVAGSITALFTAFTLLFFALGAIGQSLGSALFPTLSALAADGDMVGFRARLVSALRGALFLAFPAMLFLILLGEPLVKTLFERGQWSAESSAATAWALAFYAAGMAGFVLLELLSRAFYALEDSRTPVLVGVAAMLANILLSLLFIRFIGEPGNLARGPFAGLALANALTTNVEALVLWWLLRRRLGNLDEAGFLRSAPAMVLACAALAIAVALWLGQAQSPLSQVLGGGVFGLGVFLGLGMLLRLEEARALPRLLLARLAGLKAYSAGAASPLSSVMPESSRTRNSAWSSSCWQCAARARPRSKSATDSSSVRSPRSRRSRMPSSSAQASSKERSAISLMFVPVLHAQRQVAVAQLRQQRVACLRLVDTGHALPVSRLRQNGVTALQNGLGVGRAQ